MPKPTPTVQPRASVAPMPASAPQVMPTPGKVAPVVANPAPPAAPTPMPKRNESPKRLAPMPQPEVFSPPALPTIAELAPRPYRNLLYFSNLEAVLAAIAQAQASADEASVQEKQFPRRFAWVRARYEPEIAIASLSALTNAVFDENTNPFDAEALLDQAIAKLPAETAATAVTNRAKTLQLEGLWTEFPPQVGTQSTVPRLAIAVSVSLASAQPSASMVEPLVAHRVHLTFGDFQP